MDCCGEISPGSHSASTATFSDDERSLPAYWEKSKDGSQLGARFDLKYNEDRLISTSHVIALQDNPEIRSYHWRRERVHTVPGHLPNRPNSAGIRVS
jgi:hypothetical protein